MKISVNSALFIILLIIYVILSTKVHSFYVYGLVDWYTIAILSSLIVVNAALLISGGIDSLAHSLLKNLKDKRSLFLFSILVTLFLSMFLTNDVALIVLIPITVAIGRFSGEDIDDVIIYQAIAANVGSMLMPFGNPQNIIIYRESVLNFYKFIEYMFPPFIISAIFLIIMTLSIKKRPISNQWKQLAKIDKNLFSLNFGLLVIIIVSFLYGLPYYIFLIAIIVSAASILLKDPSYIARIDFVLIFTFILIFYDINLVRTLLHIIIPSNPMKIYLESLVLSQFISNVPTTVLFGKINNWIPLAYGVDIGGNGTLIASLANLIAFRGMGKKDIMKFTKISIVFLAITCAVGAILLMLL